ncbi:MAG: glycosyltransferase [Saprospiraceae bacterium]|nr:MAG: glycosyltransferase [Saprospiraceae bacterium]
MTQAALILFIKNLTPGKVKTRIAATAGDDMALKIYQTLLAHTRDVALDVAACRYVFYSHFIEKNDGWPEAAFIKKKQSGADIGERMAHAIGAVLLAHSKAVLAGGDIPGLRPEIIEQAFEYLTSHDFVIGPASDGGYYLIGMKEPQPSIFHGIAWSTDKVFAQTVAAIEKLGKTFATLPTLPDVDYEDDWREHGWEL